MKGQGLDTPGEAADGGGQEAGLGGWASGKLSPRGWKPQRGGHGEARGRATSPAATFLFRGERLAEPGAPSLAGVRAGARAAVGGALGGGGRAGRAGVAGPGAQGEPTRGVRRGYAHLARGAAAAPARGSWGPNFPHLF